MNETLPPALPVQDARPVTTGSSWKKKLLVTGCVLLGVGGLTAASAGFWYNHNFNASKFEPVQLSLAEQDAVKSKLAVLEGEAFPASDPSKTVVLNEREINGFLESQGLGETVKVHINRDGVGATLLAPVEQDVPIFGGHTIRVNVAFNTKLDDQHRFALSLAEVKVGGISLPNSWLGGIKGLNLLDEAKMEAHDASALKAFAAGIKSLHMRSGEMRLVLND